MEYKPKHLVVRIPMTGEPLDEIVEKHNAVASSMGGVWFGSRGQAPGEARLILLKQQLERSIPTFLYVVQRKPETIQAFQSPILSLAHSVPSADSQLIPPYYVSFGSHFKAAIWLKVGQFKESPYTALRLLQMETTGSPVTFVLMKSMASILIVVVGESEAAPPVRRWPLSY
jgi:hypothetical protein